MIILFIIEQAIDSDPEEEDVLSDLVASLRREPLTYFRDALKRAEVLEDLDIMLSVRREEEEYESGRLGLSSHLLATKTITNSDIRFKQLRVKSMGKESHSKEYSIIENATCNWFCLIIRLLCCK